MKFVVGELVTLASWLSGSRTAVYSAYAVTDSCNKNPSIVTDFTEVVACLDSNDVAIVLETLGADHRMLKVLTRDVVGWVCAAEVDPLYLRDHPLYKKQPV